jgi:KGK domain
MSEHSIPYQSTDGDVIQFGDNLLYRVGNFKRAIDRAFADSIGEVLSQQLDIQGFSVSDDGLVGGDWTDGGIDVEILSVGSIQWQTAKIKLQISFELVDRPESLSDIDIDIPSGILNDLESNFSSLTLNSVTNDANCN